MTSSLSYLLLRRLKNNIKSIFTSPAKIIYALFMIAMFGFVIFAGNANSGDTAGNYRDMGELAAIVTAYFMLMFGIMIFSGLKSGASIFKMPDVNLIFVGPFSPMKALFYGLIQQFAYSLLVGFFIFFQYAWMRQNYGVQVYHLILILVGYSLNLFLATLCAMVIYAFTSSSAAKQRAANAAVVIVFASFAAMLLFPALSSRENPLPAVLEAANSFAFRLFPVAGWIGGAVGGLLMGDMGAAVIGLAVYSACFAGLLVLIKKSNPDYYEDVLQTTEKAQSAKDKLKQGVITETAPKNVKTGKTGIKKGLGASVFLYKGRLENRRTNVLLINRISLVFVVVIAVFSYFMRDIGIFPVYAMAVYMLFFSVALGRFVKELAKPYIYLVPESSFKKLFWTVAESFSSYTVEGILVFIPVGIILGLGPVQIIFSVFFYFSCALVMLSANIAAERIFGSTAKTLLMIFYTLLILLMLAPGIVLSVFLNVSGAVFSDPGTTLCIASGAVNLLMSVFVMFLCRNILDNSEYRY